jgi:hypothetical protein
MHVCLCGRARFCVCVAACVIWVHACVHVWARVCVCVCVCVCVLCVCERETTWQMPSLCSLRSFF